MITNKVIHDDGKLTAEWSYNKQDIREIAKFVCNSDYFIIDFEAVAVQTILGDQIDLFRENDLKKITSVPVSFSYIRKSKGKKEEKGSFFFAKDAYNLNIQDLYESIFEKVMSVYKEGHKVVVWGDTLELEVFKNMFNNRVKDYESAYLEFTSCIDLSRLFRKPSGLAPNVSPEPLFSIAIKEDGEVKKYVGVQNFVDELFFVEANNLKLEKYLKQDKRKKLFYRMDNAMRSGAFSNKLKNEIIDYNERDVESQMRIIKEICKIVYGWY